MSATIRLAQCRAEFNALFAFRYSIHVDEMIRRQKYADHFWQRIRDPLDETAYNFAAWDGDEIVGCVRVNFAADGGLEYYRDLLRMDAASDRYPEGVALCTRLLVVPKFRGSLLAERLCVAGLQLGLEYGVDWNFIDCNDHLVSFFERMGYERTHEAVHEEYGRVHAMRFDSRNLPRLKAVGSPLPRNVHIPTETSSSAHESHVNP